MIKCWCRKCRRRLYTMREYIKQEDTCDRCYGGKCAVCSKHTKNYIMAYNHATNIHNKCFKRLFGFSIDLIENAIKK